jgi:hypothetical protein
MDKRRLFRELIAERFPSGQREQTVNLPAQPSEVRILPSPPFDYSSLHVKAANLEYSTEMAFYVRKSRSSDVLRAESGNSSVG